MSIYYELTGEESPKIYAVCGEDGKVMECRMPDGSGITERGPLFPPSNPIGKGFDRFCRGDVAELCIFASPAPDKFDLMRCEKKTVFSKHYVTVRPFDLTDTEMSAAAAERTVFDVGSLVGVVCTRSDGSIRFTRGDNGTDSVMINDVFRVARLLFDLACITMMLASDRSADAYLYTAEGQRGPAAALEVSFCLKYETDMPSRNGVPLRELSKVFPFLSDETAALCRACTLLGFEATFGFSRSNGVFSFDVVFDRTWTDPDELKFRDRLGKLADEVRRYVSPHGKK